MRAKFLQSVQGGHLLARRAAIALASLIRPLIAALVICSYLSGSALAQSSGMFAPRTEGPTQIILSPDEARGIARTLSDCETQAALLATMREERGVLRQALDAQSRATEAYKEAARLNSERADTEAQRADNEKQRATNQEALTKAEHDKYVKERRKSRWKTIAIIGIVVATVAAQIYRE